MYLDVEDQLVGVLGLEKREDLERRVEVRRDPVVHEHELPFRRGHLQRLIQHKLAIVNRLMEVTVIEHNVPGGVAVSHGDVLVQDQLQTGVVSQVAFHLNRPVNGAVDDVPAGVEQDVDPFE